MANNQFSISVTVSASPEKIYEAYLSSRDHAAFTGSAAKIDNKVGGMFMAWDGYITGKIIELVKNRKITQTWRTTEFKKDAGDSIAEIGLLGVPGGTKVTLTHKNLPEGTEAEYEKGWKEYYFAPMNEYFAQKDKI